MMELNMTLVASIIGAVLFGGISSMFVETPQSPEGELTILSWALVGVIAMIVLFSQFGLV
jgi:uncharacterized membrane protein YeaQ/YmgE (transglycosylase-associated protein family)